MSFEYLDRAIAFISGVFHGENVLPSLTSGDPIAMAAALFLAMVAYCFFGGLITNTHSYVDQLWSLAPIFYAWIFAACAGGDARVLIMAAIVTAWGIRLTYNFARKGVAPVAAVPTLPHDLCTSHYMKCFEWGFARCTALSAHPAPHDVLASLVPAACPVRRWVQRRGGLPLGGPALSPHQEPHRVRILQLDVHLHGASTWCASVLVPFRVTQPLPAPRSTS